MTPCESCASCERELSAVRLELQAAVRERDQYRDALENIGGDVEFALGLAHWTRGMCADKRPRSVIAAKLSELIDALASTDQEDDSKPGVEERKDTP